jgi:hypothetical protein
MSIVEDKKRKSSSGMSDAQRQALRARCMLGPQKASATEAEWIAAMGGVGLVALASLGGVSLGLNGIELLALAGSCACAAGGVWLALRLGRDKRWSRAVASGGPSAERWAMVGALAADQIAREGSPGATETNKSGDKPPARRQPRRI